MDDNEIVELYLSRNEDAINQTAIKYGSRLRKIAFRVVDDFETAKECENSAYFKTWESIPPYEPRDYLFAFVGRIIRHIALDICKMNNCQKRQATYCELTQEMQDCIPSIQNTENEMEAKLLSGLISDYLKTCSLEQQNIFVRRYWYFDSVAEISEAYGFTQSKVKTTLFRMREELREYLGKGGFVV